MAFLSLSLLIPIAYLSILIGSMATFSSLYRRRQALAKARLAPYFPPHTARNVYLSLTHMQDDTKMPESVLRAALLARAVEDVHRIMEIRQRKPALAQLLQRGAVGDEIMQRLQRAEQGLEIELKDVMAEANALAPGWGQTIFQSASEMAQNKAMRDKIERVKVNLPADKAAWDAQREKSRRELMGEAEPEAIPASTAEKSAEDKSRVATEPSAEPAEKGKAVSSDEDGVIVEPPTSEAATPGSGGAGGGGKNKKKKGKK